MGYDILKEVSISDILEAKMKRTIGERLKKARKDAKIRQGAAAEKMDYGIECQSFQKEWTVC